MINSIIQRIRFVLTLVGPGLIIASVCLGPGSVTTASMIGADYGYALIWVVVLSASAMMMYTVMGARFGASQERSFLQVVAARYGRWLAMLIGLAAFLMSGSFQFGNNLGVTTATASVTDAWASQRLSSLLGRTVVEEQIWPLVFTGMAVVLVLFAKDLYRLIERLMIVLVLLMISAFFINLLFARPDLGEAVLGLLPSIPEGDQTVTRMAAMVGTTFVLHACLYQSYLVQAKGWTRPDVRRGVRDAMMGIAFLSLISILVMLTSASVLRPEGVQIANAGDMARQLEALLGPSAKVVFCLGFWAAAFSSIPVNAIVGGGLLADGLGLGHRMSQPWPRFFALVIMITGMLIASFFRGNQANALVVAQAATMLAMPAVAIGMFVVLNDRKVMDGYANTWRQNILASFGLLLVLVMSYATYGKLNDAIVQAREARRAEVTVPVEPEAEASEDLARSGS